MIPHFAALIVPGMLVLAGHPEPETNVSYTCKFEAGVIVIDHAEAAGRATVHSDGSARRYIFDQQKLVATDAGLPTYYLQPELKRWKRLNDRGETVETTVCKANLSSKTAGSIGSRSQ